MKHTPGPWHIEGTPGHEALEVHAAHRRICKSLYHMGSEDNEADYNAYLITAAPDLLVAAEDALGFIEELAENHVIENWTGEDALREAIAKACGKRRR